MKGVNRMKVTTKNVWHKIKMADSKSEVIFLRTLGLINLLYIILHGLVFISTK